MVNKDNYYSSPERGENGIKRIFGVFGAHETCLVAANVVLTQPKLWKDIILCRS